MTIGAESLRAADRPRAAAVPAGGRAPGAAGPLWRRRVGTALTVVAWLYFAALLAGWILLGTAGDRWWPATLMLYGPRWPWALPLAGLVPAAALLRRKLLWPLGNAAIVAVLLTGFNVPFGRLFAGEAAGPGLRILTCNAGGGGFRPERFEALLREERPDVVMMQEAPRRGELDAILGEGWHLRTTPGMLVASRHPILRAESLGSDTLEGGAAIHCLIDSPAGRINVFNLHLETPREGIESVMKGLWRGLPDLDANTALRAEGALRASRWVGSQPGPILVAGDFNMTTESAIYRESWSAYTNAFSAAGLGLGHTKFTRWFGARIDHVLAGPGWVVGRCSVGPDLGSDHRPVIADVRRIGSRSTESPNRP